MIEALDPEALALNRAGSLAPAQRRELEVLLLAAGGPQQSLGGVSATLAAVKAARRSDLENEAVWAYLNYPRLPSAADVARDLQSGQVTSAPGDCLAPRSCRVAALGGDVYALAGLNLMPGPYRFHYVAASRIIVNAEPLEPTSAYVERHRAALDALFGGGPDDLAANRLGLLSARQAAAQGASGAASQRDLGKRAAWCVLIGLPLLGAYFALRNLAEDSPVLGRIAAFLPIPLFLGGVFLVIYILGALASARSAQGTGARRRVDIVEGRIARYPTEDTGYDHQVTVGGQLMGLRQEPAAVVYGLHYRAFRYQGELIGLDPLEGPCGASLDPESHRPAAGVSVHAARAPGP